MKAGLLTAVACLFVTGACGPSTEHCAANAVSLDEQAIGRTIHAFVNRGQPLDDGSRSVSASELQKVGDDGLVHEGELLNEAGNDVRLFAYRTRTDPTVQFIVTRETQDACHREVSWRISASTGLAN